MEAIVCINYMVFKDQLIAVSEHLFIYAMCRSSILKWQYMCRSSILKWQCFRNLIILFLNEYNHNGNSFVSELRKMLQAAIGRCSPKTDVLPTLFWILTLNIWKDTKTFRKFLENISKGVRFYWTVTFQSLYLLKRTPQLKKILTFMLKF